MNYLHVFERLPFGKGVCFYWTFVIGFGQLLEVAKALFGWTHVSNLPAE